MNRSKPRAVLWRATVLSLLVVGTMFSVQQPRSAHATALPSGLPTHFGIGLAGHPDSTGIYGWMPNSGIPWDYAYQYLSGGVNTGGGWQTWNSGGQFPLYYAQGAASHGYIPVLSYYELLQSTGTCGSCGEAQKDLSNLNNTSTMASYFQNFTLLMQRLGSGTYGGITGFSKTAIVHVEPDLSGFAEQATLNTTGSCFGYCSGQGNNPALLQAAVASSGDGDVVAYPNTYQGFNWALLHLRDLYAPNVQLAFHVSNWATATDIGSNTSATLDARALGQEAGSFAAQSGVSGVPSGTSSYDVLFNDASDRDAGYYKYVYNNPNAWWDRLNVAFPNFKRWETYLSAINQTTGRSLIVWQAPLGNQYFATENNTNGHYQDNRAEYFFAHVSELAQAGIIGVLFGAGNGGSTVNNDGMNDGVTNPASMCIGDGFSSGQICNNHTSTVSDDDGGYVRMQAQQYYAAGGYSLSGTAATATSTPTSSDTATTAPATHTPMAVPTSTAIPPTATKPAATNTPAPPTATKPAATSTSVPPTASFTNTAASPNSLSPRHSVQLSGSVALSASATNVTVIYSLTNASRASVYTRAWSSQSFTANSATRYSTSWKIPSTLPTGAYTFQIDVRYAGGATVYGRDTQAGTVTVF